jgi:uncharacterized cupredoxin-like copper-binding protein
MQSVRKGELPVKFNRRTVIASIATVSILAAFPARADATVSVSLWDKPEMDMATGLGHGMGGEMSTASMGVTAKPVSVSAGTVTFEVTNDSKDTVHEMIVAPLKAADEVLPYDENGGRVDEEAAGHLGEVAELAPGAKGALTVDLKPGSYILYCNIPGHYMGGMWTVVEVK